jgi:hypothetical protein
MQLHRASFIPTLIAIALAGVCLCAAYSFQEQARHAQRATRHAMREAVSNKRAPTPSLAASPSSEQYLLRAWWMFYAAIGVCAFAVVMAVRHRCWINWLGVVAVAAIALAIPFLIIWVL